VLLHALEENDVELWDAYDKDGNKTGQTLVRGERQPDGLYHLVSGILVQHVDGSYLLMRRAYDKKGWPGLFEASAGGAVQQGEEPLEAAKRELAEETGITRGEFSLMYTKTDRTCHYFGYLCVTDWPKDGVVLQERETVEYRWVSGEEMLAMMARRPFEVVIQRGVQAYLEGAATPFRMERSMLNDARDAMQAASVIPSPHRPARKLAPEGNWMNDPNGLIFFRGQYHAFWQSYPYEPRWHHMHWGHAVSSDLVHWDYLPVALAPDQPYEDDYSGGCFSGSAIEKDGKLWLMYTAMKNGHGSQCMAFSEDGVHFEKYAGNPVIPAAPEGHAEDFRDPKVFEEGGMYYAVVGSSENGDGCAVLYRSENLTEWAYLGVIARSEGKFGRFWECPDLFRLGDHWVLGFSPIGMEGRKTCWMAGKMDFERGVFTRVTDGTFDHGWAFYAPQTFSGTPGRVIQLGWQRDWTEGAGHTENEGWQWSMTVPRAFSLDESLQLRILPAKENFVSGPQDGSVYARRVILRSGNAVLWPRGRAGEDFYVRVDLDAMQLEAGRELPGKTGWDVKTYPLQDREQEIFVLADRNAIEVFLDGERLALSVCDLSSGEGLFWEAEQANMTVEDCIGME